MALLRTKLLAYNHTTAIAVPTLNYPCAHKQIEKREFFDAGYMTHFFAFARINPASSSCRLCRVIRKIILSVVDGHLPSLFAGPRDDDEKQLILDGLKLKITNQTMFTLRFNIFEKEITVDIFAETSGDPRVLGHKVPRGFVVGPTTNSETTFNTALKWLRECQETHTCLKPDLELEAVPKRLLCVQGGLPNDPQAIRLVETRGLKHSYACLSYRWGIDVHRQLKTTVRSIQDYMVSIPWEDLPRTFQDAVMVCRRMKVDYVWIDSLCILQRFDGITNDELQETREDFAKENSTMARTYQNSLFTISADLSTHMDSGIFSQTIVDCQEIEVTDDANNTLRLYFRGQIDHDSEQIPDIETRGWTFQEFSLPPRVLHFGKFDLEWRCRERLTCECGELDRVATQMGSWHRHHKMHDVAVHDANLHDAKAALKCWEGVLYHYTARALSHDTDKLPALSGLAQLYSRARDDTYLAGLWRGSLYHDLCWFHTEILESPWENVLGRRTAEYRAPSWSWASVEITACCKFWWKEARSNRSRSYQILPRGTPREACIILDAVCEPKTVDPTGEVKRGALEIESVVFLATVRADSKDCPGMWTIERVSAPMELSFFKPDCVLEDDGLCDGGQVFCVPILEAIGNDILQKGCLVLKKVFASLYQRVGFCVLEIVYSRLHGWRSIESFLEEHHLPDEKVKITII